MSATRWSKKNTTGCYPTSYRDGLFGKRLIRSSPRFRSANSLPYGPVWLGLFDRRANAFFRQVIAIGGFFLSVPSFLTGGSGHSGASGKLYERIGRRYLQGTQQYSFGFSVQGDVT